MLPTHSSAPADGGATSRKHKGGSVAPPYASPGSGGLAGMNLSSPAATAASASSTTATTTPAQYLSRLIDVHQMDIQSALDQMKTLCSITPQRVYKMAYYRKQTKNHWARDDPAFCALQALFLVMSSIAYCVSFRVESLLGGLAFLIQSVLVHWLGSGVLMATLCREVANSRLTVHQSNSHVRQGVEWLYAFDIHCNAFFPLFVLLYGVQFFLLPIVLGPSFLALTLSNTLYAFALSWYFYVTHLGYRALPFLSNTEVFLFPIAGICLVYALNLIGYPFGLGWNASRLLAHVYFD